MEHITNEQLGQMLRDHIEQHKDDTAKIMLALYGDKGRGIKGLSEQVEAATDIIIGAKFLGTVGKAILILGGVFGLLWALFMKLKV